MKTFKILFAAIIIAGFATTAIANDQPSASINASAQIFATIEIAGEEEVNFGGVEANNNAAYLNPQDANEVNFAGLGGVSAQLGRFLITGESNADILITVDTSTILLNSGDNNISYTPEFAYAEGTDNTEGSAGLTGGETGNEVSLSAGNGEVFVGGTLGDRTDLPAGVYTNENAITVSVEYN